MLGWIKLHRVLLQNCIFNNEKLLKVFIWCLLKASHTDFECLIGLKKVKLKKGQFVYGRKKASEELKMKERTLRDYMDCLKSLKIIAIKPANNYSVITVSNWAMYQEEEKITASLSADKPPTKRQRTATYKNDKNDKNIYIPTNFSNIKLKETEYEKLIAEYGEDKTKSAIEYLSNYKIEKGYKTKSDYLTIRRWVVDAVNCRKSNVAGCSPPAEKRISNGTILGSGFIKPKCADIKENEEYDYD